MNTDKKTEKGPLILAKGLSVIKESDQLSPLMQISSKFSPNLLKRPIGRNTEIDVQTIETAIMTQSLEDTLLEYKKNPFFRAKLNVLLKSKISQPLTLQLTNKQKICKETDTLKQAKRVEGKDLKIKLQKISRALQKGQPFGPSI